MQIYLLAALVLLFQLPLLVLHGANLWKNSHYQYFPVVLLAYVLIINHRLSSDKNEHKKSSSKENLSTYHAYVVISIWGIFLSVALAVLAIYKNSPWLGSVSCLFSVAAVMSLHVPHRLEGNWFGIWMLLWLIIPLPLGLDQELILQLQILSSKLSSKTLDFVGVNHLMQGNTLKLPGKTLFVDEACSGIQSLFALLALTSIFVVASRRSWAVSLLLVAATLPMSIIMNTLRISSIAYFDGVSPWDLSQGIPHEVLGLVIFALTSLLMMSLDQLFLFILGPIYTSNSNRQHAEASISRKLINCWNEWIAGYHQHSRSANAKMAIELSSSPQSAWKSRIIYALVFVHGILFIPQLMAVIPHFTSGKNTSSNNTSPDTQTKVKLLAYIDEALAMKKEDMPEELAGFKLISFKNERRGMGNIFGEHSRIWGYQKGNLICYCSLDFLFSDAHDLPRCYKGQGWEMTSYEEQNSQKVSSPDEPWIMFKLTNPFDEFGTVWCSSFTSQGVIVTGYRAEYSVLKQATNRYNFNAKQMIESSMNPQQYFQFQLFSQNAIPLQEEDYKTLTQLYLELRNHVVKKLVK